MKNFELFVIHIIKKWKTDKKILLESAGLNGLSNREYGDLAELFVLQRVEKLMPKYSPYLSNGSQSPADILAVGRRKNYWHIMLIQVKSSDKKENIYKLNADDVKVLDTFAKFVKSEFVKSDFLSDYSDKSLIISTGYSAVLRNKMKSGYSHTLIESRAFKIFKLNASSLDIEEIKKTISEIHKL